MKKEDTPLLISLVKMLTYILFLYLSGLESGLTAANQEKVTFGLLLKQKTDINACPKERVGTFRVRRPYHGWVYPLWLK